MLARAPDNRAENRTGYPKKNATTTPTVPGHLLWDWDGDGAKQSALAEDLCASSPPAKPPPGQEKPTPPSTPGPRTATPRDVPTPENEFNTVNTTALIPLVCACALSAAGDARHIIDAPQMRLNCTGKRLDRRHAIKFHVTCENLFWRRVSASASGQPKHGWTYTTRRRRR